VRSCARLCRQDPRGEGIAGRTLWLRLGTQMAQRRERPRAGRLPAKAGPSKIWQGYTESLGAFERLAVPTAIVFMGKSGRLNGWGACANLGSRAGIELVGNRQEKQRKKFAFWQLGGAAEEYSGNNLLHYGRLAGFTGSLDDCTGSGLGGRVQASQIGQPESQGDQEQAGRYDVPGKKPAVTMC
jgi:hypothetical protein